MTTATLTNRQVLARHRVNTDGIEHLDLEVPFLTGPQRQGDLLILPVDPLQKAGSPVPAPGVTVVAGETTGGNAHILHVLDGEAFWAPDADASTGLVQGCLTVPEGSTVTLLHTDEHNVLGIGPGSYELRRQQEFAGVWRRLSD